MDLDHILSQTAPDKLWIMGNMVGTAVCFGWFGTLDRFFLDQPTILAALLLGLIWGMLQWVYLRQRPLTVSLLWPFATSLGWLFCLPFLAGAATFVPTSQADILVIVSNFIKLNNIPLKLVVGYTIPTSLLVFFGILAGMPLSLPQLAVLWLKKETQTAVQGWFGSTVWGWSIGLAAGGILINLTIGIMNLLPGTAVALPRWLVFTLLGLTTGGIHSLFAHFFLYDFAAEPTTP